MGRLFYFWWNREAISENALSYIVLKIMYFIYLLLQLIAFLCIMKNPIFLAPLKVPFLLSLSYFYPIFVLFLSYSCPGRECAIDWGQIRI